MAVALLYFFFRQRALSVKIWFRWNLVRESHVKSRLLRCMNLTVGSVITEGGEVLLCILQWWWFWRHMWRRYYAKMEAQVEEIPASYRVGAVTFETDRMRLALVEECKAWKRAFGAALNRKAGAAMENIFTFTDNLQKILRWVNPRYFESPSLCISQLFFSLKHLEKYFEKKLQDGIKEC